MVAAKSMRSTATRLYASRVFDRPLGTGLVKDYAFTLGFDASRNNNLASAKKRALVFGPTLKFNGPGVLDLSLLYYREKNHFGVPGARHPDHTFDTTYMLNLTWMRPFKVGNHAAKFRASSTTWERRARTTTTRTPRRKPWSAPP